MDEKLKTFESLKLEKAIIEVQIDEYKKSYLRLHEQIQSLQKSERELISIMNTKMDRSQFLTEQIDNIEFENTKNQEHEWRMPNGSTTD